MGGGGFQVVYLHFEIFGEVEVFGVDGVVFLCLQPPNTTHSLLIKHLIPLTIPRHIRRRLCRKTASLRRNTVLGVGWVFSQLPAGF